MNGPLILIIKENTDSEISCTYLQKKIPREPEKLFQVAPSPLFAYRVPIEP